MPRSKSATGVMGELAVASKYIKKGYWVAMSMCPQCPFDLVVVDKNGKCRLIDVKSISLRKTGRQKGLRIGRNLSDKQKEMEITIEYVDPETLV